jgi:RNA polymerase-interacting CarD/CdnL/TRCF family regulator
MKKHGATTIAGQTAQDVLETIARGEKKNITKSAMKYGATHNYAKSGQLTETKEYREIMTNALDRMSRERERIMEAMENKDLSDEKYQTLTQSLTTLTHDIQLLSGGKTENVSIEEDRRLLIGIVEQLRERVSIPAQVIEPTYTPYIEEHTM